MPGEAQVTFPYSRVIGKGVLLLVLPFVAFAFYMNEQMEGRLTPDDTQLLDRVETSVTRMNSLITDLLSLARVSQGQLQRMDVNLSDLAAMAATPAWCTLAMTLPMADPAWLDVSHIRDEALRWNGGVLGVGSHHAGERDDATGDREG